jgi:hypothetical protein
MNENRLLFVCKYIYYYTKLMTFQIVRISVICFYYILFVCISLLLVGVSMYV